MQGGVVSDTGMRDTARPVFVHTGFILKRKDTPHRPNYLIKGEVEQGQMVHMLRNYQQSAEPQRTWKNKTVPRYLRGGQILALMSDQEEFTNCP